MDEHIAGLIESLECQLALYKRLLEVTLEEQAALAKRDVEAVRSCMNMKSGLIADIRGCATRIARSVKSLSACFSRQPQAIADLARSLSGSHERRLNGIRGEIDAVRISLSRENRRNGLFAGNFLRYASDMIGILSETRGARAMYDGNGKNSCHIKPGRCDRRA